MTFKDLASNGLVLNASGFVNSPRSVAGARSDLLFTILDRLRSEGIALSSPQSLLMIRMAARPAPRLRPRRPIEAKGRTGRHATGRIRPFFNAEPP